MKISPCSIAVVHFPHLLREGYGSPPLFAMATNTPEGIVIYIGYGTNSLVPSLGPFTKDQFAQVARVISDFEP